MNNLTEEEKSALRAKDSDEDGISDFDEVYVYKTSAYLADSDSDGINDLDEIKAGEDPNCPVGLNCFRLDEGVNAIANGTAVPAVSTAVPATATTTQTSGTTEGVDLSKIKPETLRKILLDSGKVTQAELDQLDDATILGVFDEMIKTNPALAQELAAAQAPQPPKGGAEGGSVAQTEIALDGSVLTATQIRELLKQQGVSESEINQVDDATLMKMYEEALANAKTVAE